MLRLGIDRVLVLLGEQMLSAVNSRHIPGASIDIQVFYIFRKAVLLKLQGNRKPGNLGKSFSLNYIILASHPKHHNLRRLEQPIDIINDIKGVVNYGNMTSNTETIVKSIKVGSSDFTARRLRKHKRSREKMLG